MEQNNLSLYHIFNAVAEAGNISKAAKELYISQPAISKAVTKLEQNLDVKLFSRNSRGVTLTEAGSLLYEQTNAAFKHLKRAEDTIKKNKELGTGHIKIGVSTTLCKYVLLPYLEKFVHLHPHIRITIHCQSTYDTLNLLQAGKIDVGLVGEPSRTEGLHFKLIKTIEDVFACTPSYLKNLEKRNANALRKPLDYANIMLLNKYNISRRHIDEYMRDNEIFTEPLESGRILEVSSMDLLIEFAKVGLGIACVIREFIEAEIKDGALVTIPLKTQIKPRNVGFVYLKDRFYNDALDTFIDFFSKA